MGHQFQSDLRRWDIVAGLCQAIDAKTYVEVGCKDGKTTAFVLEQCPLVHAIAIDPWCEQTPSADVLRETYKDWDFSAIRRQFWENVGDNRDRCEMLKLRGTDAKHHLNGLVARGVQSGLCVVFIDALHDFESVQQDISDWWPLVRAGGYLCGHDFQHRFPGVMRAVAEHFNLMDVCLGPDSMWWLQKPVPARAAA